jgi:acetyl-CoA C-acetyltransferase
VLVAWGQVVAREGLVGPLELARRAVEEALEGAPQLRQRIDRLSLVNVLAPVGEHPAARLAAAIGMLPSVTESTHIGGNTPQWLVTRAASDIASGKLDAVLVVGSETQRSVKLHRTAAREAKHAASLAPFGTEDEPDRPDPAEPQSSDRVVGDPRAGIGEAELQAGLIAPVHIYALFESVIAAEAGRSPSEHRRFLGQLLAPMTKVASQHPYAWFQRVLEPDEIAEPRPDNRVIAEPYTKLMCAFLNVDQAACVVVTSLALARDVGLDTGAVFVWSGADANDVWFPTERPELGRSPGITAASSAALAAAGVALDDLTAFDLYSCFPCAIEMAADALGLALDDPRGVTVTGGLPYFGGPGNDYTLHAIATVAEQLRNDGGEAKALVSGLGWYATKHSIGIYGASPPPAGFVLGDTTEAQARIDATAVPVALEAEGAATVVAATVAYGPTGEPTAAPVICRLDDGRQAAAAARVEDLASLAGRSIVGERVILEGKPLTYRLA